MLLTLVMRIVLGSQIELENGKISEVEFKSNEFGQVLFVLDIEEYPIGKIELNFQFDSEGNSEINSNLYYALDFVPTSTEYNSIRRFSEKHDSGEYVFKSYMNSKFYFLFTTENPCKFSINATVSEPYNKLIENIPYYMLTYDDDDILHEFTVKDSNVEFITISFAINTRSALMYITKEKIPTSDNSESVIKTWNGNLEYSTSEFKQGTRFRIAIRLDTFVHDTYEIFYYIIVKTKKSEPQELKTGKLKTDVLTLNEISHLYFFEVGSPDDMIRIHFETFNGNGYILISHQEDISDENYDFGFSYYENITICIYPEDRVKLGKTTGKYFIKIFGSGILPYNITWTNSRVYNYKLIPNNPEIGMAYQNKFKYFTYEFSETESKIFLILEVLSGDSDLYAKLCKETINNCTLSYEEIENPVNIYSSCTVEGNEYIEIPHNPNNCYEPSKCFYLVGVFGKTEKSIYKIEVSSTQTMISLTVGKPFTIKTSNEYTSFNYYNNDYSISKFTFEITELNIKIAFNAYSEYDDRLGNSIRSNEYDEYYKYNEYNASWIRGVDLPTNKGKFFLIIRNYDYYLEKDILYSVIIKLKSQPQNDLIRIYSRAPIQDQILKKTGQDYMMYMFPVSLNKTEITIKITPIFGKVSFSLACTSETLNKTVDANYFDWQVPKSTLINGSLVYIISGDNPLNQYQQTIIILVTPEEFIYDGSVVYQIEYSEINENILMSSDVGLYQEVGTSGYISLKYPIQNTYRDVVFSINFSDWIYIMHDIMVNDYEPTFEYTDIIDSNLFKDSCPHKTDSKNKINITDCYLYINIRFIVVNNPGSINCLIRDSGGIPIQIMLNKFVKKDELNSAYYYIFIQNSIDLEISVFVEEKDLGFFYLSFEDWTSNDLNILDFNKPNHTEIDFNYKNIIEVSKKYNLHKSCPSGTCILLINIPCINKYFCPTGFLLKEIKHQDEGKNKIKFILWFIATFLLIFIAAVICFCQRKIYFKIAERSFNSEKNIDQTPNLEE